MLPFNQLGITTQEVVFGHRVIAPVVAAQLKRLCLAITAVLNGSTISSLCSPILTRRPLPPATRSTMSVIVTAL